MTNIIMRGCNGRMGQVISGLVAALDNCRIVAGIDLYDEQKNDYPVYKSLIDCLADNKVESADVIIDFASPKNFDELLGVAVSEQIPIVLCTTGLSEQQLADVETASKQIAILRSANMSMGINTVIKLLKNISAMLTGAGFDVDIVERHHKMKLDAPSGTALALADAINDALPEKFEYVYDRSSRREIRPKNEIGISAVRGGSIVGEHEVIFAGVDEVIEIKHTAYSRAIFGNGAIQAALFLAGKPAGMYDMSDVIG